MKPIIILPTYNERENIKKIIDQKLQRTKERYLK